MSLLDDLRKKQNEGTPAPVSENTETLASLPAINPPEGSEPGPTPEEVKAAAPPPEVKPKRERKKKSESVPEQNAAPATTVQRDTIPAPASTAFTLYVDCYPIGQSAKFVDAMIERAKALVVEELSTHEDPHYRVNHYKHVPFGKGPGCLELAFFKLFDTDDSIDRVIYTATEESSLILAGLVARAHASGGIVVRGVR